MYLHWINIEEILGSKWGVNMNCYMVLGNKSVNGKPSSDMIDRVSYVNEIIKNSHRSKVILSGSNGEAKLMRDLLDSNLTNIHELIIDDDSTNTIHSIEYLKNLGISKVFIITSDYHVKRVNIIADKIGIDCKVIGVKTTNKRFYTPIEEFLFCVLTRVLPISICNKLSQVRKYRFKCDTKSNI